MKKNILIAITLLIPAVQFAQLSGRDVAWAHGLGSEGEHVWQTYMAIFNAERQIDGQESDYTSNTGINSASNEVSSEWISNTNVNPTDPNNIAIGHSMGGLVMRDVDRDNPATYFGGIITVGSPNNGADIVNSIQSGEFEDALSNATRRMTAGPLAEAFSLLGPPATFLSNFVNPLLDDAIQDNIVGPLIEAQNSQSFEDLAVNGTYINDLNSYTFTVPRISIWGNEQSPVHWRIASSFASNRATDATFVELAKTTEGIYTAFALLNGANAVTSILQCIIAPTTCLLAASHANKAIQWNRGRTWLRQSEDIWLELINCNSHSSTTAEAEIFVINYSPYCDDYYTGTPEWIACYEFYCGDQGNGCAEIITVEYHIYTGQKSDGLLCGATQIGDGIGTNYHYEALGVNHAEETNSSAGTTLNGNDEVRDKFNLIWNRNDFFNTPPR